MTKDLFLERAGGLPGFQLIKMATSPGQTYDSMMRKFKEYRRAQSQVGTRDAREVEKRIDVAEMTLCRFSVREHGSQIFQAMKPSW